MSNANKLQIIETYKAITAEAKFEQWKLSEKQALAFAGKHDYLQAEWTIKLSIADRFMVLSFTTGMRDLEGPTNILSYVVGETSWLGQKRTKINTDNKILVKRIEQMIREHIKEGSPKVKKLFGNEGRRAAVAATVYPTAPTAAAVLYCLASDTDSVLSTRTFEEWAENLGFDTDSRRAHGMYVQCQSQGLAFSNLVRCDVPLFCEFVRMIDEMGLEAAEEEFLKEKTE